MDIIVKENHVFHGCSQAHFVSDSLVLFFYYCETTGEIAVIYFLSHCHSDHELCRITFKCMFPNPVNIVHPCLL
jgi:hypothetical protein